MSETKEETMTVEGLKPAFIEGQDPGSTYQVVVRTGLGYVAVRRMSKYAFRVRCERFDKKPLLTVNDQHLMVALNQMKLKVGTDAVRVSGTFLSLNIANAAVATLTSLLVGNEQTLQSLQSCKDKHYVEMDEKIDAQKVLKKAAAGDIDAMNRNDDEPKLLGPVDPPGEIN